jgi:hypothetical protein
MDKATESLTPIEIRIKKAADVLKIQKVDFEQTVKAVFGIELNAEGLQMLDAQTTTEPVIVDMLSAYPYSRLCLLAVAAILKGRDPFAKQEEVSMVNNSTIVKADTVIEGSVIAHQFVELTKSLRDPKQLKDKELLELYDKERDYEVEQELHRRAGFQHFIVLKADPITMSDSAISTKKAIDIEMSLELLKRSRRMVNPSIVPQGDLYVNVYRITELNPEDQIVEICPFCGEITYKGYCENCNSDFKGTGDNERALIKLITEMESFDKNSMSDRRAVLISAGKGLEDLRRTWPKASKKFSELSALGDLPKLKKSKSLPSSKPADPFHVSGNRTF